MTYRDRTHVKTSVVKIRISEWNKREVQRFLKKYKLREKDVGKYVQAFIENGATIKFIPQHYLEHLNELYSNMAARAGTKLNQLARHLNKQHVEYLYNKREEVLIDQEKLLSILESLEKEVSAFEKHLSYLNELRFNPDSIKDFYPFK